MTLRLIVSLFTAAAFAFTQPPAPSQSNSSSPDKKGALEGKVLSLSGEPLRKATLHLRIVGGPPGQNTAGRPIQTSNYTITTDATGKFLFEDIDSGRYTLFVEHFGYVQQFYGARAPNRPGLPLNLVEGGHLTGLTITMTPQAIISGKVEDEDGDPISAVQVMVYRVGYQGGQKQFLPAGNVSVNPDGTFMAGNLEPGHYYLSASDTRPMMMGGVAERSGTKTPEVGYVTTYYPGTADQSAATPIDIAAGSETRGVEIRLIKARMYQIRGKVTGLPYDSGSINLTLMPRDRSAQFNPIRMRQAFVQAHDGSFTFRNITPGSYTIQSNRRPVSNTGRPPGLLAYFPVTVTDQDLDGITVPLGPGIDINGTIRIEAGPQTTQGITAGTSALSPRFRIGLQMMDGNFGGQNVQTGDDGTFEIHGLVPGKFRVNVAGQPGGSYVKYIHFGGLDVTHDDLDLTSGSGGALEVLFSPKAADLSGFARNENGDAVPNASVTLWTPGRTANSAPDAPRVANTDQNGSFQLSNLAPGEYRIAAWEDIEPGLAQNPEFRALFESKAAKVTLQESAHATVEIKLIGRDATVAEAAKLP
ncbi:MAG: carboxypeptidase-like regulatory domain-containing protein [Gemmatimonadota bacterium]|nr:carboxypeptidase-like regulatory domain-containing protein [Gemmatimonadota bacterium]